MVLHLFDLLRETAQARIATLQFEAWCKQRLCSQLELQWLTAVSVEDPVQSLLSLHATHTSSSTTPVRFG